MISINDVTKIDEKRKQIKKEIYTRVYEQFSRKIKQSVELGHKQVFLTVPTFVIGYPTFDRGAAARYIMRQLRLGGFDVRLVSDYDMYVSWIIPKKVKQKVNEPDETEFPDLMNLKKMADKYRRGA
ncbi:hypothetical protein OLVG_00146 [Ostreococcus lucimarinus virus OlV6]|jgi:hypothetical protein|uniref:hypothetical protein n=1 Tax=Ostreococcus tauri virus 2 TaxID=696472 RepID=UPI0001EF463A|nr:hypothetical protein OtV2_097 [Ostreococcus tauri virus 2]YP_007674791.1 hypothetical protein OLNG_00149 [Ostreococcus lucimarinus virus OlV5]AFK65900.1 hypothetical protein OLVG_00146 [Ostreococcus lucimarinus virus OlV6]AGH31222.1 hypothetical protein OLNG_00149 [Ostreococcus lucimarinus virus OlV5]CBI70096.1 hypothetical protein OtV2_097 [Ostreococcus tauri virus 2]